MSAHEVLVDGGNNGCYPLLKGALVDDDGKILCVACKSVEKVKQKRRPRDINTNWRSAVATLSGNGGYTIAGTVTPLLHARQDNLLSIML